jgi:hypothetical protein
LPLPIAKSAEDRRRVLNNSCQLKEPVEGTREAIAGVGRVLVYRVKLLPKKVKVRVDGKDDYFF